MQYTTNYSLKKPDFTDIVDINDFNSNVDKIDEELKKVNDSLKNNVSNLPSQLDNLVREINIKQFGAKCDGVTNDYPAFKLARENINENDILYIPNTIYLKDSLYSDFSMENINLKFNNFAKLITDTNVRTYNIKLFSDVVWVYGNLRTTLKLFKNMNIYDPLVTAINEQEIIKEEYELLKFRDSRFRFYETRENKNISLATGYNISEDGYTLNYNGYTGDQTKGAFINITEGESYSVTFDKNNDISTSGYFGAYVMGDDSCLNLQMSTANTKISVYKELTKLKDIDLPNGASPYALKHNDALTITIKNVNGRKVELYINEWKCYEYTFNNVIAYVGHYIYPNQNGNISIKNPIIIKNYIGNNTQETNICMFGDSTVQGALNSLKYEDYIKHMLSLNKEFGKVNINNFAIGGQTSSQQLQLFKTKDLSLYDYCVVNVGINDVQTNIPVSVFISNITEMINICKANNCIPIIALFPIWTQASVTGNNVYTRNFQKTEPYITELRKLCVLNNVSIANIRAEFGADISLLGDNIHYLHEGTIKGAKRIVNTIKSTKLEIKKDYDFLPMKIGKEKMLKVVSPWVTETSDGRKLYYYIINNVNELYYKNRLIRNEDGVVLKGIRTDFTIKGDDNLLANLKENQYLYGLNRSGNMSIIISFPDTVTSDFDLYLYI